MNAALSPVNAPDLDVLFREQRDNRWAIRQTSIEQRIETLKSFKTVMEQHRPALIAALRDDCGKHPAEAQGSDIDPVMHEIDQMISNLAKWAAPKKITTPLTMGLTSAEVIYEPLGQVLVLSPWNYPVNLALVPVVGAIAAGNVVILRPSEKTPKTSQLLKKITDQAFDRNHVATVLGDSSMAKALTAMPFDHIFFTGSSKVGKTIMEAASKNLASVTLELGGKSPTIVTKNADLSLAASRIVWGKFVNAGQTCIAPDHVWVDASVQDDFLAEVTAQISKLWGDVHQQKTKGDYAKIISSDSAKHLKELLNQDMAKGAHVVVGGTVDAAQRFFEATVVSGITADHALMQSEIFGPILPVLAYEQLDDVLKHLQQQPKPLAMYVFSGDKAELGHIRTLSTSGGLVENGTMVHFSVAGLPFGGVNNSGLGHYHGEYSFLTFSHARSTVHDSKVSLISTRFPPYSDSEGDLDYLRHAPRGVN